MPPPVVEDLRRYASGIAITRDQQSSRFIGELTHGHLMYIPFGFVGDKGLVVLIVRARDHTVDLSSLSQPGTLAYLLVAGNVVKQTRFDGDNGEFSWAIFPDMSPPNMRVYSIRIE